MSLTCKQMLIVNDLFYKRSSLWWFLYEHISGLSSALLNHLHTGNWRWEYYSHVRPHYSVCKAQRRNWVSGTFNCNCSSTCRAIQDFTTSCQLFNKWGQISLPNRREDVFLLSCCSCLRRTSQLTPAAVFSVTLFWIAGHWFKQSYKTLPLLGVSKTKARRGGCLNICNLSVKEVLTFI